MAFIKKNTELIDSVAELKEADYRRLKKYEAL